MGPDAMNLVFLILSFKPFSLPSKGFLVLCHFLPKGWCHLSIWGYWCSPSILDSSLSFIQPKILHDVLCKKLSKHGDNIQPWCTPFPIWNQPIVSCPILTVASWAAYRFFTGQVRWSSHLLKNFPPFVVIHIVKGFGIVNKAEVDAFLEFYFFFDNPADAGNLISDSSAFSKTSLNI